MVDQELAKRFAVWGSPIGHSLSPKLHRAAYRALDLKWSYESQEVTQETLAGKLEALDASWGGLSLTMPLKAQIVPFLTQRDPIVELISVANTVVFSQREILGYNTDVFGIAQAIRLAGVEHIQRAHILGDGSTALSALVALAELGAKHITIHSRRGKYKNAFDDIAHSLELDIEVRPLTQVDRSLHVPEVVVSTIPAQAQIDPVYAVSTRKTALLLDVAYDSWPTALAFSWQEVGGKMISGLAMLVQQALMQIRIFITGEPFVSLPHEEDVLVSMRKAVEAV